MANASKNMVIGSMAVAGLVAVAAIADLVLGIPFAGQMVMDVAFLIGAGLVIYMSWDAYKDMR